MSFSLFLSTLGLVLFTWRLKPWRKNVAAQPAEESPVHLRVSIVIPCRNEEQNIASLLKSLRAIREVQTEIIVVDDESTDRTAEIARQYDAVEVIPAPPKPTSWVGKSWACWVGAKAASSDYILFTDADTHHEASSLIRALRFLRAQNADLISAPPYHRCQNPFERALGLFHLLPLIATAYRTRPTKVRAYSIGQYLLARKSSYFECGGHETVRSSLAEDLDMTKHFIGRGKTYAVYPSADLYSVQMYRDLRTFLIGWKRLLRLGLRRTSTASFLETLLVLNLFVGFNPIAYGAWIVLAWSQAQHGRFSVLSVVLSPLSCVLFIGLSVAGMMESIMGRKVMWHGRLYSDY